MADPTQTNISQTTIPDYAKPYVETLLGKAEAVTDISKNPYKAYPGERTALFTDLQNQAFKAAGQLGPASQLTDATSMAQKAGLGALGIMGQDSLQISFRLPARIKQARLALTRSIPRVSWEREPLRRT